MRHLVLRPEAEAEIAEAADWYEGRGKGLGAALLRRVDGGDRFHPAQSRDVSGLFLSVRRAVLRRFPYSLNYASTDNEIVIHAGMHSRRAPRRWQQRV